MRNHRAATSHATLPAAQSPLSQPGSRAFAETGMLSMAWPPGPDAQVHCPPVSLSAAETDRCLFLTAWRPESEVKVLGGSFVLRPLLSVGRRPSCECSDPSVPAGVSDSGLPRVTPNDVTEPMMGAPPQDPF